MAQRLLLSFALCAAPIAAQSESAAAAYPIDPLSVPRPVLQALRIDEAVDIDGVLDEAAWSSTRPTEQRWIQITPEPGMPATEHTVVRVMYDDARLYIGAVLYDQDPNDLIVPGLEQDYETTSSDMFGVALDTYRDRQNGFVFAINPAGAVWDAQTFDDQATVSSAWEGIVDVRTSVNDSSWVVEMAIPFGTLRFSPSEGEQIWGVNFTRRLRRRNEDSMWAPVPLQYRVYRFSLAGSLEGLRDLPRGRNVWVKPYALGDRLTGARHTAGSTDGDVGVDVKWGLTPRMTLDLTANTDFSQVEVDAEQVNLTRFSLFFPEKRDFFLENEGTFAFQDVGIRNFRTGSSSRAFRLFHSRRIGLSDSREPLPIAAGARLTGRLGERVELGFLDMQTRSVRAPDPLATSRAENFAVGRVRAHLREGAWLGAMVANRQETGVDGVGDYNRSYGVDGTLTAFRNIIVSGYYARTDERDAIGEQPDAAMGQVAWRSSIWNVSGLFKHVGDGFNPRMGFVDRTGVRRYFATVGAHPKVRRRGVLEVNPYVDFDTYTSLGGRLESRTVTPGVNLVFMNGGSLTVEYADRYERLFADTPLAGSTVPAGTYEWREPSLRLVLPGSKTLSGRLSVSGGDFFDGRRASVAATALFRPNEHVSLAVAGQHNDLELGGSSFTADLFSARLRYARDTRTFFLGFVQYNEATEELIANVRFNLVHAPLSDLFLVYSERRSLAGGVPEPVLERGVALKLTKLFAF